MLSGEILEHGLTKCNVLCSTSDPSSKASVNFDAPRTPSLALAFIAVSHQVSCHFPFVLPPLLALCCICLPKAFVTAHPDHSVSHLIVTLCLFSRVCMLMPSLNFYESTHWVFTEPIPSSLQTLHWLWKTHQSFSLHFRALWSHWPHSPSHTFQSQLARGGAVFRVAWWLSETKQIFPDEILFMVFHPLIERQPLSPPLGFPLLWDHSFFGVPTCLSELMCNLLLLDTCCVTVFVGRHEQRSTHSMYGTNDKSKYGYHQSPTWWARLLGLLIGI